MQGGPALPSLSTCSTDSRQDYVSTIESRSRGGRPPRRAAAAAALEHNHFVFGSPAPMPPPTPAPPLWYCSFAAPELSCTQTLTVLLGSCPSVPPMMPAHSCCALVQGLIFEHNVQA